MYGSTRDDYVLRVQANEVCANWFKVSAPATKSDTAIDTGSVISGIVIAQQQGSQTRSVRGSYFTEKNIDRISTHKNKRCILGIHHPSCNAFFIVFVVPQRDLTQHLYQPIVKRLNKSIMPLRNFPLKNSFYEFENHFCLFFFKTAIIKPNQEVVVHEFLMHII